MILKIQEGNSTQVDNASMQKSFHDYYSSVHKNNRYVFNFFLKIIFNVHKGSFYLFANKAKKSFLCY